MRYGCECTYATEQIYKDLTSAEAQIIKRSFNLSKFHCTNDLLRALRVEPIKITLKKRKLNFLLELEKNPLIRKILESQLKSIKNTPSHCFLREICHILNLYSIDTTLENLISLAKIKITQLDQEGKQDFDSEVSRAIRYLLSLKKHHGVLNY